MRAAFILILLLIAIIPLHTQTPHQSIVISEENLRNISKVSGPIYTTNMNALYEGVKGTPYLFNEWRLGNIYLKDNELIKNVKIKYNIYTDDLLYLNSTSGDSLIINRSVINKFEITNNQTDDLILMEKINLKPEKSDKGTFVKVLYKDSSKFILKYSKMFIPANYKGAYPTGNKYDEYTDKQQYYLITGKDNITKIRLKKKSVIKVLSDREDEIKDFIREKDLRMDNVDDIISVLKYYDSLTD
jgi:hypothetical protein